MEYIAIPKKNIKAILESDLHQNEKKFLLLTLTKTTDQKIIDYLCENKFYVRVKAEMILRGLNTLAPTKKTIEADVDLQDDRYFVIKKEQIADLAHALPHECINLFNQANADANADPDHKHRP
jgi:hypothetical protein